MSCWRFRPMESAGTAWLDLVRYSETNGTSATRLTERWRYRDYVIQAFNQYKPFDRFFSSSLRGPSCRRLRPRRLSRSAITRLGPWDDEPADPKEDRRGSVDDMVSTTSQVFLG